MSLRTRKTVSADTMSSLRCLVMPLSQGFALLPSALVQALLYNEQVEQPTVDAPPWLLGSVYRDACGTVPLISLDAVFGWSLPQHDIGHIALLRHVSSEGLPPFFALRLSGAPWVVEADSANVVRTPRAVPLPCVACDISLDGQPGVIPDLDQLGDLIASLPPAKTARPD